MNVVILEGAGGNSASAARRRIEQVVGVVVVGHVVKRRGMVGRRRMVTRARPRPWLCESVGRTVRRVITCCGESKIVP